VLFVETGAGERHAGAIAQIPQQREVCIGVRPGGVPARDGQHADGHALVAHRHRNHRMQRQPRHSIAVVIRQGSQQRRLVHAGQQHRLILQIRARGEPVANGQRRGGQLLEQRQHLRIRMVDRPRDESLPRLIGEPQVARIADARRDGPGDGPQQRTKIRRGRECPGRARQSGEALLGALLIGDVGRHDVDAPVDGAQLVPEPAVPRRIVLLEGLRRPALHQAKEDLMEGAADDVWKELPDDGAVRRTMALPGRVREQRQVLVIEPCAEEREAVVQQLTAARVRMWAAVKEMMVARRRMHLPW
jgi:hypothetical protein